MACAGQFRVDFHGGACEAAGRFPAQDEPEAVAIASQFHEAGKLEKEHHPVAQDCRLGISTGSSRMLIFPCSPMVRKSSHAARNSPSVGCCHAEKFPHISKVILGRTSRISMNVSKADL